jgi:predicted TIM-barrel fold metal-dependent hydrolase
MKTTRRQFIAAAGSAMAALPLGAAAPDSALTPRASRTSSGIVDCQSHLFCSEMIMLMEKRATDPRVFTRDGTRYLQMGDWLRKLPPLYTNLDAKLATMDAAGIGLTTLSINDPGPEWFGADGPAVAQMANDFVAGLARKHPARFVGLCVLPWQDVPAAERELDRCVRQLGMKGLLLYLDIVSPLPQAMKFAVEYMGSKHLLYASDHPWVEPRLILDGLRSLNLPANEEDLILRDNARQLFQL